MNENIISWNFPNWVTITLMAAVGFLILAGVAQLFHAGKKTSASNFGTIGAVNA